MQELSSIRKDFDALCEQYGLPKDEKSEALFGILLSRDLLVQSIFYDGQSVFEIARMLKQLSGVGSAGFTLQNVGGVTRNTYSSPELVEVLKKSLVDALQKKVVKHNETWVNPSSLGFKGVPKDKMLNLGKAHLDIILNLNGVEVETGIYLYPEGVHPSQDSFSEQELDAILGYGKRLADRLEKMKGNKVNFSTSTRNPELGKLVLVLSQHLPEDWNDATRNAFLADYLCLAGVLDFKGTDWVENFKGKLKEDKGRQVRRWVESYLKTYPAPKEE